MSIPRETIDLIRDRASIEDIIKKYVPTLKKRGANYIALCPFHKEKTPSFTVSPEKQIFHCFGCHAGGNVFSFISKIEGLNFPESVRFVGNLVGIRVEEEKGTGDHDEYKKLKYINRIAAELYHRTIKSERGNWGLEYFLKRGLSRESIDDFYLGFSPDSWDYLINYLKSKDIPLSYAEKIGIISVSKKGGDNKHFYDRFRNRVIFPIFNRRNEIVAFGGRITGEGEPKYLNSPESIIYQKRRELYGFNIARQSISELGRAIVVEGYLDVIGCHQAGVKNVVAPLGTALTSEQVRILSRLGNEVVLLFDADSAGINAALRSIDVVKDVNVNLKIAVLPEGDPFDFIQKKGAREFMSVVDSALKPVDFRLSRIAKGLGRREKPAIIRDIFSVIRDIEFETERDEYFKKVSSMLNIDESSLRADFVRSASKNAAVRPDFSNKDIKTKRRDFLTRSYEEIILLLCRHPELIEQASIDFSEDEFIDPVIKNIFRKLRDTYSEDENLKSEKIIDIFAEGAEREFLEKNLTGEFVIDSTNSADDDYTKRYLRIKIEQIDRKIDRYTELINKNNSVENININDFIAEIEVLRREKEKISVYL